MKFTVHPFTIERIKQKDTGFLNSDDLVERAQTLFKAETDLSNEGLRLADAVSERYRTRDSVKKKLVRKLKKIDFSFDYAAQVFVPEIEPTLRTFQDHVCEVAEQRQRLAEDLKKSYWSDRAELVKLYRTNEALFRSVPMINPEICPRLESYLTEKVDDKKTRKLELVLTRLATHATTKTSPLAFLNEVDILGTNQSRPVRQKYPLITVNHVMLLAYFEAFLLQDHILPLVPLQYNKNYYKDDESIHIFSLTSDPNNKKVYRSRDQYLKIPLNKEVLAMEREQRDVWSVQNLCELFKLSREQACALCRRLIEVGLLRITSLFHDGMDAVCELLDALDSYSEHLTETDRENCRRLEAIHRLLAVINRQYDEAVHEQIIDLFTALLRSMDLQGFEPRSFLYIDHLNLTSRVHPIDEKTEKAIETLVQMHPVFDINTKIRQEFLHVLKKGEHEIDIPCAQDDLFATVGNTSLKFNAYWAKPNEPLDCDAPVNQALETIRMKMIDDLLTSEAEIRDGVPQITIPEAAMQDYLSAIPECVRHLSAAYSFFYQSGGDGVVINKIYPGYLSFYHRFLRYTDAAERYGETIREIYDEKEASVAEIYESMGFNANVYDPIFNTRIKFDISLDDKIDEKYRTVRLFDDLRLVSRDNEFFLKDSEGTYYKPVISTSLIRILYPGKLAFFSSLFSNISLITDLGVIFFRDVSEKEVTSSPRITYNNLVLERAQWYVPCQRFESLKACQNDEQMWLEMVRLFTEWGLPSRFFFRSRHTHSKGSKLVSFAREFGKPQYCDLNNQLLFKVLLNAVRTSQALLLSEVYPEAIDAPEFLTEWTYRKECAE